MRPWSRNLSRPKFSTAHHLTFAFRPGICGGMPECPLSATPTLPSSGCARISRLHGFCGVRRQHVGKFDASSAEQCGQTQKIGEKTNLLEKIITFSKI